MMLASCLLEFLLLCVISSSFGQTSQKPHIFMVLIDDLGYHNVGFHNPEQISPNINAMVENGILLEGHYTFQYCSPTRSSFLSGRLPIHVNMNQPSQGQSPGGIDLRMTLISEVLKEANYSTAFIGKGHIGAYSHANLPINRGFDSHFGFLGGGEDHLTQKTGAWVDLWRDHAPAYGENGTYSCDLYGNEATAVLAAHDPTVNPLFMYLPMHDTHSPYECTDKWMDPRVKQPLRQLMQCMLTCTDDVMGRLVTLLKHKNMWDNTLFVWSSDNGGPQYWGANNYPLRGGKGTDFEGGVRTAAFVSGGLLPVAVRGTTISQIIHVCDWYRTFGVLAGVLPSQGEIPGAKSGGVPAVDALDMWPLLSGANTTSPRTGFPLSQFAIRIGDFKYINGSVHDHESWNGKICGKNYTDKDCEMGQWTGPTWPVGNCGGGGAPTVCPHVCDAASNCTRNIPCSPGGCLFDIAHDPLETRDLSLEKPNLLALMQQALLAAVAERFQTTDSNYTYGGCAPSWAANVAAHHNFAAPLCTTATPPHVL
eukprot:m.1047454 g.1047454  ORF g.1047454 m.1047454 type:complete len:536 (-) comp24171_c1_seq4:309-1916(-)